MDIIIIISFGMVTTQTWVCVCLFSLFFEGKKCWEREGGISYNAMCASPRELDTRVF